MSAAPSLWPLARRRSTFAAGIIFSSALAGRPRSPQRGRKQGTPGADARAAGASGGIICEHRCVHATAAAKGARELAGPERPFRREDLAAYARPDLGRSLLELATSVVPYLALSYAMYRALDVSYLLVLALSIPASGFLVRTFILFHDLSLIHI